MVCFTQQRKRMSRTLVLEDSISLSKDMNTHGSFRTAIRPNMIKKKKMMSSFQSAYLKWAPPFVLISPNSHSDSMLAAG